MGGSTTNEIFLDEKDTWTEKLENQFNLDGFDVDIVNAGVDGQSTLGHIYNFENWFFEIKDLKPKFIIFYIGINEGRSNHYLIFDNLSSNNYFGKIKDFIKKNNGISFRLYRKIKNKINLKQNSTIDLTNTHNIDTERKYKKISIIENSKINLNFDNWIEKEFIQRLKKITEYSQKMGSIPIFISQRSLRWFKKGSEIYEVDMENIEKLHMVNSFYIKEKKLDLAIKNFANNNSLYFISRFELLQLNEDLLYDYTHTNVKGSEYISNQFYPYLKKVYLENIK